MPTERKPLSLDPSPTIPVELDPRDSIIWAPVTAHIEKPSGEVVFHQDDVLSPHSWSKTAVNIAASKYFHGNIEDDDRESSIEKMIGRVSSTVSTWAHQDGLLDLESATRLDRELFWLCVQQKMAFNSPVWFNVGVRSPPQCSACFINPVLDSMESILGLAHIEGMIFKWGSGTGTNFSTLRSSGESLAGGGTASGPVSFMEGFDAFAGVIKSGGQTRRAAKMAILNVDHPDILDFIICKAEEEEKARAMIEAGFSADFDDPHGAYASVRFQNANHSVRVNDGFMKMARDGGTWVTRMVADGSPSTAHDAKELMLEMAKSAWICGDPGIQFDDAINRAHTCSDTSRIDGSNPCSEFLFVDGSACNLASLNLLSFLIDNSQEGDDSFSPDYDIVGFEAAAQRCIISQDAMIDHALYPTKIIEKNSWDYRPLGLGYANLGGLLLSLGLPYDSETGRMVAGAITSLMTAVAYRTSAQLARAKGPFRHFEANRVGMLGVIDDHINSHIGLQDSIHANIEEDDVIKGMLVALTNEATEAWNQARIIGREHGFRNAQVTLLAPTGTTALIMDCETTGVEPEFALTKTKQLVGGGTITTINPLVPAALRALGYRQEKIEEIEAALTDGEYIENVGVCAHDLAVFDCSAQSWDDGRFIEPEGHIKMMAAVQPFISGAISKTVNMPSDTTPEKIVATWMMGWELGLKAIAIYRNGCKSSQPLNAGKKASEAHPELPNAPESTEELRKLVRKHMPEERASVTHKFRIGEHEGYVVVGLFPDGKPGEIFVTMSKEGTVISGLMNVFTTAVSIALQYGVPLAVLCEKFEHTRFDPSGLTANSDSRLRFAKSITDYLFRWMRLRFLDEGGPSFDSEWFAGHGMPKVTTPGFEIGVIQAGPLSSAPKPRMAHDGEVCNNCGALMDRSGSCHRCPVCGHTSGCS